MSSNLTGKFIANTYQKLLQVDNVNGSNGAANFDVTDVKDGTYDLLNGIGQELPYMVVNQLSSGNGGYFIRKGDTDDDVVGLQIEEYNGKGIQFWNGTSGSNGNLFLKNTGSLWVGYRNSTGDIYTDVNNHTLYVNKGIHLNKSGNNAYISVADDSDTIDGNLSVRANNHQRRSNVDALGIIPPYGATPSTWYGQLENFNIFQSGITTEYKKKNDASSGVTQQLIWQRVGNVVNCNAFINHTLWTDGAPGTPNKFNVPVFLGGFDNGTFDNLIGNGVNFNASLLIPVEVKGNNNRQFVIERDGGVNVQTGTSRVSFSYELKYSPP